MMADEMSSTAHNLYSSYREALLEHLFAGELMRYLWCRGVVRIEMLKPQVDDGGYDLVLEANGHTRHIQLKASHHGAGTDKVGINLRLAERPSGCVVWIWFDPDTLALGPFYWFGGAPGERLPDIAGFKAQRQTRANAKGGEEGAAGDPGRSENEVRTHRRHRGPEFPPLRTAAGRAGGPSSLSRVAIEAEEHIRDYTASDSPRR